MKRSLLQQLVLYEYRYLIGYMILFALTAYAMFWRLGTLVPGLSAIEIEQAQLSGDLGTLADNPLDPLFRVVQWLSFSLLSDPLVATRFASALFGALCVVLMYKVVTLKFSARVGIVTSIVFAMSSWLLSYARFGHPAIATVLLILALIYTAYKSYETRSLPWLIALAVTIGIGVYHRWFVYFLIIGTVISLPVIKEQAHLFKKQTKQTFIILGSLLLFPLAMAIARNPELARELLNLPSSIPGPGQLLSNAQESVSHIFWISEEFPVLYLGTVPMLDIFSAAMVALGLYHLDHEISKTLSRFVLTSFLFSFILLTINPDPFAYAILIPFTYILVAAGFIMLISQWNEIFPKNPIARTVAFIPLTILVISVVAYHNERYFLAWPRTPEVLQQYPESIGRLNSFIKETSSNIVIIGTSEERATYDVMSRTYDDVQFISTEDDVQVLSVQAAVVTPAADTMIQDELRQQLPENRMLLSSSSSFEPTLFVVYSQE